VKARRQASLRTLDSGVALATGVAGGGRVEWALFPAPELFIRQTIRNVLRSKRCSVIAIWNIVCSEPKRLPGLNHTLSIPHSVYQFTADLNLHSDFRLAIRESTRELNKTSPSKTRGSSPYSFSPVLEYVVLTQYSASF
jgi:hypothetical protein